MRRKCFCGKCSLGLRPSECDEREKKTMPMPFPVRMENRIVKMNEKREEETVERFVAIMRDAFADWSLHVHLSSSLCILSHVIDSFSMNLSSLSVRGKSN